MPKANLVKEENPLEVALGCYVDIGAIRINETIAKKLARTWRTFVDEYEKDIVYMPAVMQKFVAEFYAGLLPEYEK